MANAGGAFYAIFMKAKILTALLLVFPLFPSLALGAGVDENSAFFQNLWGKISDISNEAIDLADDEDRNERTTLEILTFRDPKYERLLRDARDVLGKSELNGDFEAIDHLRRKNRELAQKIVELKRKRVSAPKSSWNPLVETRGDVDEKLRELPEEINGNEAEIEDRKRKILQTMRERGIDLSDGELNYFLVSAEGDELLRLMAIAENMKSIQGIMERQLAEDPDNVELARIYTGMCLVSLDAFAHAHDSAIGNISGYRKKLESIAEGARANHEEAARLKKRAAQNEMANVEANLAINERTLEVAEMYDSLLQRRARNLAESKENVKRRVELARNTYKTMVNGGSLIDLVSQGSRDYALLVNFEMPELKNLYDAAMLNAFADISEKIRAEN